MELKWIQGCLRALTIAGLAVFSLAAAEHHGVVKVGGVPIPGATVTATQADKKQVAVTDETGTYAFADLPDGTWKIQVEMLCFATETKEVGIAPNAPGAEWELKLLPMDQIKSSMQAAPAPSAPPTTATAPAAGTATPTPGAPATPAPAQTAAATPAKPAGKNAKNAKNAKGAAPAAPSAGFQRADVNASADAAAAPPTAPGMASAASEGSAASASDSLVVNGSGSNGIERRAIGNARKGPGSLFNGGANFMFDNSVLNARSYSLSGQDTPKAAYNHFQVGLSFGGPLWVPHVFRWTGNFFVTYQTTRNRNAQNGSGTMPTAAERAGDFSQITNASGAPITILDPTTGQPFPNSLIPAARISPTAQYLLNFYPLPQIGIGGLNYNYQIAEIARASSDMGQVRINKTINNKNFLNASFGFQSLRNTNPNLFNFVDTSDSSGFQFTGSLRHTFSRQVYGNFSAQYSRQSIRSAPFFAGIRDVSGEAGINGNDRTPGNWGPPALSFQSSGISGLSDGNENFNRNQSMSFTGTVNWIRRPHNFQFGGDFRVQDFSIVGQSNGRGSFGFDGSTTGLDFAGFLLGIPDTSNLALGNADKYMRAGMYDAYVTDDWRIGPSFTLNLGVRWEYGTPVVEKYNRLVNLDIAPGFASAAPVVATSPVGTLSGRQYPRSLLDPDKHAVQPRLSFAWKPIFGASTTVRGGYGVYYNTAAYIAIANRGMIQQAPLSKSISVHNGPASPLTLNNGFIASPTNTADTFGVDPNYRVGYSQNWTLSVQQNVTPSMVMTATYTGIKGTRAAQQFLPNTYPVGAVNPCLACLPGYSYLASNGNSTRESGKLGLRRRFHGGLSTVFEYTYSKSIDDAGGLGTALGQIAQDWLNLANERGLSSFDQRHVFTATFQYSTGAGIRGGALLSGWRGSLFKGWTITSNINAGTGLPLSPVYAITTPLTGINGTNRPQYIGGDVQAGTGGRFLNSAVYAAPPLGQWGNAGRNSITGPNQFNMDASMQRSFKDNISVRFDSSNVLNHTNFTSWYTSFNPNYINGGNFGLPAGAGGMRTLKATLRWSF